MTEPVVTTSPPSSPITPTKDDETKKTNNSSGPNKFAGEGQMFRGKLIGMEDLSVDREEKVCLDSMFKLKAVVKARGEHKQRIQLNLTMNAVKVIDELTKATIATHEIERISFVVIDPRDNRAFGYIYNTTDDRHQFWAIKTERAAAVTVLALKELFELAFEQYTNEKNSKEETAKPTPTISTGATQETSQAAPVSSPPPSTTPAAAAAAPPPPQETPSLFDDDAWGGSSSTPAATQKPEPATSLLWDMNEPVAPVSQPPATKPVDPLEDIFSSGFAAAPSQPASAPSVSTGPTNSLLDVFSTPAPQPAQPMFNPPNTFYPQPTQPNLFNSPLPTLLQQQRPSTPTTMPLFPQPQQSPILSPTPPAPLQPSLFQSQQNPMNNASSISPVAPPSVTSPFADLDLLSGLSLGSTGKTTKDAFFAAPPPKTMQQLQMEKQP